MSIFNNKKIKAKLVDLSFMMIFSFLIFYFTFAGLKGDYGLLKNLENIAKINSLEIELNNLKSKKLMLESKVVRLGNSYLDLELLDEQARKMLGMARSNEIILD